MSNKATIRERRHFRTGLKTDPVVEFYRCQAAEPQSGIPDARLPKLASFRETHLVGSPVNTAEMIEALRFEQYKVKVSPSRTALSSEVARRIYYFLRPSLSDTLRKMIVSPSSGFGPIESAALRL